MDSEAVARALIIFGVLVAVVGGVVLLAAKAGFSGLPGDISWHRGNTSVYFPIVTSLVISLVATIVINIAIRLFR